MQIVVLKRIFWCSIIFVNVTVISTTLTLQNDHTMNSSTLQPMENSFKGFSVSHKIRQYEMEDVVLCLDSLFNVKKHSIHIAFLGDSLIRNQFLSFTSLIPNYDRNLPLHLKEYESHFHENRNMHSPLLNDLLVSFRWRALVNDELLTDFRMWNMHTVDDHGTPDFIFLAHNMLQNSKKTYMEKIETDLLPVLQNFLRIHPRKQIFWVIQSPTTDMLRPISGPNNHIIHNTKIDQYNSIIRTIFKGTRIAVWDSLLPAIEEYIRSCFLGQFYQYDVNGYKLCDDFIHPGHQVLSMGSHLILNFICTHNNKYKELEGFADAFLS
ncbi:uncharacterized protein LOC116933792 isoform X2 [Daphnia magna]|uniref:uncharacterized protein LOC116933792 isoform X2 n=1 Tax=Daphnia magna TaxID=35525 RepID=UPI001E1BCB6E|nr:uncharacterized protein LOC116933792 isoform X2 [Daphnia magna]